ncbi:MAG: AbgT family transporter, partial [Planctomycetota bacterium]
MTDPQPTSARSGGLLDLIERIGNRLPDPSTLFLLGTVAVIVLSAIAAAGGWSVQP